MSIRNRQINSKQISNHKNKLPYNYETKQKTMRFRININKYLDNHIYKHQLKVENKQVNDHWN